MRTVILASVRTYARRYVAALVAVVIATAFIVAINALAASARQGADEEVSRQYRGAEVVATDFTDVASHDRLRTRLLADPAVTGVATNWQGYVDARFPDGNQELDLGSVATDPALRWQQLLSGRLPRGSDEVAVSGPRTRSHAVKVGERVSFDVGGQRRAFTVTGVVADQAGPRTAAVYLPEATFATLGDVGFPADVVVAVDGDPATVAARIDPPKDEGRVLTAESYERDLRLQATRGIDVFQKLIFVFAAISLFVGALVISNTFTILLAQRARDLALVRCIGAVRSQVVRSVVAEGLLVGAIGVTAGVGVGWLVALVGDRAIGHWFRTVPMVTPTVSGSVVWPVALGIAVTVAASYLPARRAGARSPLAALQPQEAVEVGSRAGRARLAVAAALLLVGSAGLVVGSTGVLPIGLAGGMLTFIGILLLAPVFVPAAIRAIGPVTRRLGVPGAQAHANSLRNPRRTAATATALLVGVTLISSVVVGSASIKHKVTTELDTNHPLDLLVTSADGPIPGGVARKVAEVRGVRTASTVAGTTARVGSTPVTILGVDPATARLAHDSPVLRGLGTGDVVLPDTFELPADSSGETAIVTVGSRHQTFGTRFGTGLGDAPIVSLDALDRLGGGTGPYAVWIRASDGADAGQVTADVTAIAKTAGLEVTGGLPDRADILKILDTVLAVTIGLLAIAVLIALIGVGNTLSLSVLERVRENSLLRALGLSRTGLRTMLAIEALLMAGVAAVLGIALGCAYAWFGIRAASGGVFATTPTIEIPWARLAAIFVVAAVAGLVACVLPARQAARIAPAAGLVAD